MEKLACRMQSPLANEKREDGLPKIVKSEAVTVG